MPAQDGILLHGFEYSPAAMKEAGRSSQADGQVIIIAGGGRIESVVVLDATFEHTLQARDALVDAFESSIKEASQWP